MLKFSGFIAWWPPNVPKKKKQQTVSLGFQPNFLLRINTISWFLHEKVFILLCSLTEFILILGQLSIYNGTLRSISKSIHCLNNNWATSCQNQQNGMHAQQRLSLVWSEASLSARRRCGSLAIHWAHSDDSYQTGQMPRLIWVFAGRTCHFVGFVMRRLNYC